MTLQTWTTETPKGRTAQVTWMLSDKGEQVFKAETPDGWMAVEGSVMRALTNLDGWIERAR